MFINSKWKEFLTQQGASFDADVVIKYTDQTEELLYAQNADCLADLSHFGLISVTGEEAESYLQNQLSNDVRLVTASQSQLTAYCSPKGRMLAGFLLFKREDTWYLRLPVSILPPVLKRLKMFVMRSLVTLEDASRDLVRFGVSGLESTNLLNAEISQLPTTPHEVVHAGAITVIRLSGSIPRFEIHGDREPMEALFTVLSQQAKLIGMPAWSWSGIRAGVPEIYPQTVEAFVPQMVNFAALNGISFQKGCYPGQEVVARMHYLGKLKRRMYLLHADSRQVPASGTELFCKGNAASTCGKVVEAQTAPNGGIDLLAVVQIAKAETETLCLGSAAGDTLQIHELPYSVTNEA